MAKRSPDTRQYADLDKLPELEVHTASWFLPGNPDTSDIYPTMYIRESHDLVGMNVVCKTPGSGNSSFKLERATVSGNDITGWTTVVSSFTISGNDHISDSSLLIEENISGPAYYRLIPTSINSNIRDVTISMKYRKRLVTGS